MNSHQRRKAFRAVTTDTRRSAPRRFIRHWADLAQVPESKAYRLRIDVEECNGWIMEKPNGKTPPHYHYLSTHTFYGSSHVRSTRLLQRCGFNVTLANWDKPTLP